MRALRLDKVRNEIFTTERNGTRVTAVGVDAVQGTLPGGHRQTFQSRLRDSLLLCEKV